MAQSISSFDLTVILIASGDPRVDRRTTSALLEEVEPLGGELVVAHARRAANGNVWQRLAAQRTDVRLLSCAQVSSFSAIVNRALADITASRIVVVGAGIVLTRGALAQLTGALADDRVGVVSAAIVKGQAAQWRSDRQVPPTAPAPQTELIDTPTARLRAFAIRREIATTIGPLDERFDVAIFRDQDYARRVRAAGWRVVAAPGALALDIAPPTAPSAASFENNRHRWDEKWNERTFTTVDPGGTSASESITTLLSTCDRSLGRDATVLDWASGLELARSLPMRAVVSRPHNGGTLADIDDSFDVVVTSRVGRRHRAEALRVARHVVLTVKHAGTAAGVTTDTVFKRRLPPRRSRPPRRETAVRATARRALFCFELLPDPDRASGSQRAIDLMNFLQQDGWRVSVLAQGLPADGRRYIDALTRRGISTTIASRDSCAALLRREHFQLAVFISWLAADLYLQSVREHSPTTRVVVDSLDLHFLRRMRQHINAPHDQETTGRAASDMIRELAAYTAADGVWAVSQNEATLIDSMVGISVAAVVPDCEAIERSSVPLMQRRGMLFVGNFRHSPNVDAVRRLCRDILPHLDPTLRRKHPLYIVGPFAPASLRELVASVDGARMIGWTPLLGPYLERVRISLVPVSYGAGTKRKLIQSLMAGTPCVSTSIGIEGLDLQHGVHALVTDDDAHFASEMMRLLTDDRLWRRVSKAGRTKIAKSHSRKKAQQALLAAVERVLAAPPRRPPRQPSSVVAQHAESVPLITPDVAALLRTGSGRAGTKPDVVVLSIINWRERFQRPQHLALRMAAAGHRVLYVNVPSREPAASPAIEAVAPNVLAINLLTDTADRIYRTGLTRTQTEHCLAALAELRTRLAIHEAFVKVDFPAWRGVAESLREKFAWKVVYDWFEDHEDVPWQRPRSFAADGAALVKHSDLVVTASRPLASLARERGARAIALVPNGVDAAHFAQPLPPPHEVIALRRPLLGYIGVITDWFDIEMIAGAARLRPDWTFVLIGEVLDTNVKPLADLANVVLLGEEVYSRIPAYLRSFDICLIPHRVRPRTNRAGSVKFFEYLSVGRPIIATPLEWLRPHHRAGLVRFAANSRALVAQASRALAEDSATAQMARHAAAATHSWDARYAALWSAVAPLYGLASIIVVTFNNLECTKRCLESIFSNTAYPNYEVIVVDNGSTDGTREYVEQLQRSDRRVELLANSTNLGFAKAVNAGLTAARGEYLVLLNNDTIVTPGWLGGLLAHLADPQIGAVGPITNMAGSEAQVPVSYQLADEMLAFAARRTAAESHPVRFVERLAMFCVAFSRPVYSQVGPFDERYQVGMFEDDDYCRRIRATTRKLACVSDVFVHHLGHASFSQLGAKAFQQIFEENRARFEAKWQMSWSADYVSPARRT